MPLPRTVNLSCEALDLDLGIEVSLNCLPGTSTLAMRTGFPGAGATSNVIASTDRCSTSAPVESRAETETMYGTTFLDLKTDSRGRRL